MSKRIVTVALGALLCTALAAPPAVASSRGTARARCIAEARATAGLGKDVNPGRLTVTFGTDGPDLVEEVAEDELYCGFGGDDVVAYNSGTFVGGDGGDDVRYYNFGTFYGGDGDDGALESPGTVHGGAGDDHVDRISGTFYGGAGDDSSNRSIGTFYGGDGDDRIAFNLGGALFDGGDGRDVVSLLSTGTCVDVEVGC